MHGGAGLAFDGHDTQVSVGLFGALKVMFAQDDEALRPHLVTDSGNAGQQVQIGFQVGMAIQMVVDLALQVGECLL